MIKKRKFVFVWFLSVITLCSASAAGQECGQSPADAAEAFERGQDRFNQRDYDGALELFLCANQLEPSARTLYNVSLCQVALEDIPTALQTMRDLVERFPESEYRPGVEQRISELSNNISFNMSATATNNGIAVNSQGPVDINVSNVSYSTPRMTTARRFAWGLLGSAVLLVGSGIGFLGGYESVHREYESESYLSYYNSGQLNNWNEDMEDLKRRGLSYLALGWVIGGIGLASLATSLVLFFTCPGTDSESESTASTRRFHLGFGVGGAMVFGIF